MTFKIFTLDAVDQNMVVGGPHSAENVCHRFVWPLVVLTSPSYAPKHSQRIAMVGLFCTQLVAVKPTHPFLIWCVDETGVSTWHSKGTQHLEAKGLCVGAKV